MTSNQFAGLVGGDECGILWNHGSRRWKKRLTAYYPGISQMKHFGIIHLIFSSPFQSNHLSPLAWEATRSSKISRASILILAVWPCHLVSWRKLQAIRESGTTMTMAIELIDDGMRNTRGFRGRRELRVGDRRIWNPFIRGPLVPDEVMSSRFLLKAYRSPWSKLKASCNCLEMQGPVDLIACRHYPTK